MKKIMNAKKYLKKLNKVIILPDNYYLEVSNYDVLNVYLYKIDKLGNKINIEKFILNNYSHQEIVEFGLELGQYLK